MFFYQNAPTNEAQNTFFFEKISQQVKHEHHKKGSILFHYGDMGSKFYVILSGEITLFIPKNEELLAKQIAKKQRKVKRQRQATRQNWLPSQSHFITELQLQESNYGSLDKKEDDYDFDQIKVKEEKLLFMNNKFKEQYIKSGVCAFQKLKAIGKEEYLGELSLLLGTRRSTTAIASKTTEVLSFTKFNFERNLFACLEFFKKKFSYFKQIFYEVPDSQLAQFCYGFEMKRFCHGQEIFKENDKVREVYIIIEGEVGLLKSFSKVFGLEQQVDQSQDLNGHQMHKKRKKNSQHQNIADESDEEEYLGKSESKKLKPEINKPQQKKYINISVLCVNDFFGELEVYDKQCQNRRKYTAICRSLELVVYSCSAKTFKRIESVIMDISNQMRHNSRMKEEWRSKQISKIQQLFNVAHQIATASKEETDSNNKKIQISQGIGYQTLNRQFLKKVESYEIQQKLPSQMPFLNKIIHNVELYTKNYKEQMVKNYKAFQRHWRKQLTESEKMVIRRNITIRGNNIVDDNEAMRDVYAELDRKLQERVKEEQQASAVRLQKQVVSKWLAVKNGNKQLQQINQEDDLNLNQEQQAKLEDLDASEISSVQLYDLMGAAGMAEQARQQQQQNFQHKARSLSPPSHKNQQLLIKEQRLCDNFRKAELRGMIERNQYTLKKILDPDGSYFAQQQQLQQQRLIQKNERGPQVMQMQMSVVERDKNNQLEQSESSHSEEEEGEPTLDTLLSNSKSTIEIHQQLQQIERKKLRKQMLKHKQDVQQQQVDQQQSSVISESNIVVQKTSQLIQQQQIQQQTNNNKINDENGVDFMTEYQLQQHEISSSEIEKQLTSKQYYHQHNSAGMKEAYDRKYFLAMLKQSQAQENKQRLYGNSAYKKLQHEKVDLDLVTPLFQPSTQSLKQNKRNEYMINRLVLAKRNIKQKVDVPDFFSLRQLSVEGLLKNEINQDKSNKSALQLQQSDQKHDKDLQAKGIFYQQARIQKIIAKVTKSKNVLNYLSASPQREENNMKYLSQNAKTYRHQSPLMELNRSKEKNQPVFQPIGKQQSSMHTNNVWKPFQIPNLVSIKLRFEQLQTQRNSENEKEETLQIHNKKSKLPYNLKMNKIHNHNENSVKILI